MDAALRDKLRRLFFAFHRLHISATTRKKRKENTLNPPHYIFFLTHHAICTSIA